MESAVQNVRRHHEVYQEIEVEHQDVPRQHRAREIEMAHWRNQVPETVGPPDIDHHEHQAHHNGADGQQFPVEDDLPNGLPVVDVSGNNQHHGGGRHAHQEREVPDVEAPAHLVAHGGQGESVAHLVGIGQRSGDDQHAQRRQPQPVGPVSPQDEPDASARKAEEPTNELCWIVKWHRSRRTSAPCSVPLSERALACAR